MDTATDDTAREGTAPAPHRRLPWLRLAFGIGGYLLGLGALAGLLIGVVAWLIGTEAGTASLLHMLPRVQVEHPKGALLGDFSARRVRLPLPDDDGEVVLHDLQWRGMRLRPGEGRQWLHLNVAELRAARIDVTPPRGPSTDTPVPTSLAMPLAVDIERVGIDELRIAGIDTPLLELRASVHLGADAGAAHRIEGFGARWGRLRAAGRAQVATAAPLPVDARIDLAQLQPGDGDWAVAATLTGPLADSQLQATLRAQPGGGRPAQTLDARAQLRPFAAWSLGDVQAQARKLDLAAWHDAAPRTALDIDARIATAAVDRPAAVEATIANQAPGAWSDGRLPLRRLDLQASARPDEPTRLTLQRFTAALGDARSDAGRLDGSGRYDPQTWQLEMRAAGLRPATLDARVPDMRLDGKLLLEGAGHAASAQARSSVALRLDVAGDVQPPGGGVRRSVQVRADLRLGADAVDLREVLARSGPAQLSLVGAAARSDAGWALKGKAGLHEFDPAAWWLGAPDSPWRQGPHQLNASADFDLNLRPGSERSPLMDRIAAMQGRAQMTLEPSRLAGVPIAGSAAWRTAADGSADLLAQFGSAGNMLRAEGRIAAGGADRWELRAELPALESLRPLWRLVRGTDSRLSGSAAVDVTIEGRWPAIGVAGRVDATALRIDALGVQRAQVRFALGQSDDSPLDLQADFGGVAWSRAHAETVVATLKGTPGAHDAGLRVVSRGLPPVWVERLRPAPNGTAATRSVAQVQLRGGLTAAGTSRFAGWRGTLRQAALSGDAADAPAWAEGREVPLGVAWNDGPPRVTLGPGRVDLLGAQLKLDQLDWTAADAPRASGRLELSAQLEPLDLAPLLARVQPGFGWGGDLRIEGQARVRSTPTVAADIVLHRVAGDLTVTDEAGTQPLGLSDLRIGVNASEGVWSLTAGLAGTTLGQAAGAVVVRDTPHALWPAEEAPLDGVLELQVANLGVWGAWLPAGWRLGGEMRVGAAFGGRFGAPQITGEWTGNRVQVRNMLQGVDVRDGEVQVSLQGETARIERFTARAGSGSAELTGSAVLGEGPRADLQLSLDHFQVLGRIDRRIVASGQARLQLGRDAIALDGQLKVDEGLIDFGRSGAPELSSDVIVKRGSARESPVATTKPASDEPAPPRARQVRLDLRADMGEKLRVRGRGLDAGLRGELKLGTTPQRRLRVDGTLRTVGGTYKAYRQNLVIERGVLTFDGAVDNPRLDIEATRPNLDVRVGVAVAGTALVPRVRLFSDPEMSELDKLSWLIRGRPSEGPAGGADTALLQAAAMALVSGEDTRALDQIFDLIGLDDLSVRQADGSSGGAILSVGKQLSRNWYVGYERSLNAATGTFQVVYRIAQRFTVRAKSGEQNSLELIWTWRWN